MPRRAGIGVTALTDNWLVLAVRFVVPGATVEISRVAPVTLERHSRR
jgi:hypothetical protein